MLTMKRRVIVATVEVLRIQFVFALIDIARDAENRDTIRGIRSVLNMYD